MTSSDQIQDIFKVSPAEAMAQLGKLTFRELEVAELTAMGLGVPEMAQRFGISIRTVERHKLVMRRKLGGVYSNGVGRIWFAAQFCEDVE